MILVLSILYIRKPNIKLAQRPQNHQGVNYHSNSGLSSEVTLLTTELYSTWSSKHILRLSNANDLSKVNEWMVMPSRCSSTPLPAQWFSKTPALPKSAGFIIPQDGKREKMTWGSQVQQACNLILCVPVHVLTLSLLLKSKENRKECTFRCGRKKKKKQYYFELI